MAEHMEARNVVVTSTKLDDGRYVVELDAGTGNSVKLYGGRGHLKALLDEIEFHLEERND